MPPWLSNDALKPEFVLELFDELISANAPAFSNVKSLMGLISNHLPVMIDKLFRNRKTFPVVVRLLRIILTLSRCFPEVLFDHAEVRCSLPEPTMLPHFLAPTSLTLQILIRRLILMVELESVVWLKALALEALHRFFSTPVFIVKLYSRFDNESPSPCATFSFNFDSV